jgi:hypothetical protein
MIGITMKELVILKDNAGLSWVNIQGSFNQNTTLRAITEAQEIVQQYVSETSHDFLFDGSPDPSLVDKVGLDFSSHKLNQV